MNPEQGHLKLDTLKGTSGATLSKCRKYRYVLWRIWDKSLPTIMFIGLNPSTANETQNDPTILKCIQYCKRWDFGGFYITNLFAYRSSSPDILKKSKKPIGSKNDYWVLKTAKSSEKIVACWGEHGDFKDRDKALKKQFDRLYCLKVNKSGQPAHPLYLKSSLNFILMLKFYAINLEDI